MLKPAADFLTDGGALNIDWNKESIRPPYTQQERWEEQPGHSPSTTAAVIAGLVTAGDIAELSGDAQGAARYRDAADRYSAAIERRMFTTNGQFGNGRYFLRTSLSEDANEHGRLEERNGRPGAPVDQVVDAGFLELVRYGVRRADDPYILESLPELDDESREDLLRVRYSFTFPGVDGTFPGWRRYGNDGYGEDAETGANYGADNFMSPGQRGRVWPFFTGERGHYELALASVGGKKPDAETIKGIRGRHVRAIELFANDGLLLPEQVWDSVGKQSTHAYVKGEGTDSATPLAWAHAEYVKLLRSLRDGEVWDSYAPVKARYAR
jgi:glucoamylase